jgi:hypothetical protein
LRGDLYRFIPELAHQAGFQVSEAPVNHRKRKYGRSKYGPVRFWTGLLDLLTVRFITRYRERPLHFFGTAALFPFAFGVALEIYSLVMKFAFASSFRTHITAIITGVTLILAGFQLLMTGLIGEMLSADRPRENWMMDVSDATTKGIATRPARSALEGAETSNSARPASEAPAPTPVPSIMQD